jgi:hypothetical protein
MSNLTNREEIVNKPRTNRIQTVNKSVKGIL